SAARSRQIRSSTSCTANATGCERMIPASSREMSSSAVNKPSIAWTDPAICSTSARISWLISCWRKAQIVTCRGEEARFREARLLGELLLAPQIVDQLDILEPQTEGLDIAAIEVPSDQPNEADAKRENQRHCFVEHITLNCAPQRRRDEDGNEAEREGWTV